MRCTEFYKQIYKIIGDYTPLDVDCGGLCGGACCDGDEETGMYLFPGERHMYKPKENWYEISDTDFFVEGKAVDIFICTGSCPRDKRPLACRIFPLLPYVDEKGKMQVVLDPRGRSICPLARAMKPQDLDPEFVRRVEKAGKIMMKFPPMRKYLTSLSRLADQFEL